MIHERDITIPEVPSYVRAILAETLNREGGYTDHPNDPGGATKYGISLRWLKTQDVKLADIDDDGDVDIDDIRALTPLDAANLYFRQWWRKYNYAQVPDPTVAGKVFDTAVNMGARQAHRLLQRALYAFGRDVVVDGLLGPKTLAAVQSAMRPYPVQLLGALRVEQSHFYRMIWNRRKRQFTPFLEGWLRRAYDDYSLNIRKGEWF